MKNIKINKVWLLPLIVLFALAFTPALAQETLPEAGTGFEDAVKLQPGSYIEGEIGREATDETTGTNVGAITEASFYPQESGTHYVRMKMDDIAKGKPGEYDISFSKEEVEQQETQTETTEEIPEENKKSKDKGPNKSDN